jgi:DNA polymerase-3 subunit delta
VPTITPEALRKQAASGKLAPVYLLVGDDDRMVSAMSGALAGTLEEDLRAFNYDRFYATDKGLLPASVIEAAHTAPMMAPYRLVFVLRAEAWLKPKRPPAPEAAEEGEAQGADEPTDKTALAPLTEYLKAPVESSVLVFVAADVNRSLSAVKALLKSAAIVECWGLGEGTRGGDPVRQGLAMIKQAAGAAGRSIEPAAAQMLAERSGGEIAKLRADLDHVLLFVEGKRAITVADVEAVVSGHAAQDPWALVNAIERGHATEALRLLAVSIEDGEAPLKILGQISWWVRTKLSQFRPQQAGPAVQAIFRTDLDMKSSGGDPRVLLERLVMELCGAPKRRRA